MFQLLSMHYGSLQPTDWHNDFRRMFSPNILPRHTPELWPCQNLNKLQNNRLCGRKLEALHNEHWQGNERFTNIVVTKERNHSWTGTQTGSTGKQLLDNGKKISGVTLENPEVLQVRGAPYSVQSQHLKHIISVV